MLHFEVSLGPLFVVAVANFILSWLYYSPVAPWFATWQKAVGVDPAKKEMTAEEKAMMPFQFGGAFVATFVLAYGLQVVVHSMGVADALGGALVGLVVWCTFALTHSLNTLFEGRKPVVLVINNGLYLVTYVGFGILVALWK
ncbi:MAG: DUF1761 domain-containing protein [Spirochaetales bacterium]